MLATTSTPIPEWTPPVARRVPVAEAIEVARHRLRRGERLEAAELLDRCIEALGKDQLEDPDLFERRAYAHDRSTGNGRSCLPPEVLQRVITWLTAEEIAEGEQQLAADRPFAAARAFGAADAIDGRGTRAAFLHALALHRAAQKAVLRATRSALSESAAQFLRAERCLRRAASLVRWAYPDDDLRLLAEQLAASIRDGLADLQERQAAANRMAAACSCLVDYDALVSHHLGRDRLEPDDRRKLRSSVTALSGRINRLLGRSPTGSAEWRLLTNLAGGTADLLNSGT